MRNQIASVKVTVSEWCKNLSLLIFILMKLVARMIPQPCILKTTSSAITLLGSIILRNGMFRGIISNGTSF